MSGGHGKHATSLKPPAPILRRCGAQRKHGAGPCHNVCPPGRTRCKLHGGLSTGPKFPDGKRRTSDAAHEAIAAISNG